MEENQRSDDDEEGFSVENGYDGTTTPVHIEDIDHSQAPAVVIGAIQQDGHVIRSDGFNVLVVK